MKHLLSKSTYMYGCQCLKRLYLHKFQPELANPEDEQQQVLFHAGTDAGKLAQQLFPGGADAQGDEPWHSWKTVEVTSKLLPVHYVIYEAAFMYEGVLCAVDLLVRKGNKYYAYEVKSTNSAKPQHVTDAALQYYVLRNAGIDVEDFSIVHFNRDYTRLGPINVQELFTATSVMGGIQEQQPAIGPKIEELKLMLGNKIMPLVDVGPHCDKPYSCNFTLFCNRDIPAMEEEQEYDTTLRVNAQALQDFVAEVIYPVYYLDFETVMFGVPEYDHSQPYQQIPFQYSLHVSNTAGAAPLHFSFLGDGVGDPRENLIAQMLEEIGTTGSVMVWNKTFEKGCIEKMAKQFPAYSEALLAIIPRMVDLMVPFRQRTIDCEAFGGSYSIKNILPVMVPELNYADLEIGEGSLASFTYGQLRHMSLEDATKAREHLLAYCERDTLAMVRIWEKLQNL